MSDDDPVPLKAGGEATPELVRALYALGKRGPDSARLARVADKLAAALADLPPAGPSNGLHKLYGTKILITSIVIGLAALSWLGFHLAGRQEAPAKPQRPAAVETSQLAPIVHETVNETAAVSGPSEDSLAAVAPPAAASRPTNTSVRRSHRAAPRGSSAGHDTNVLPAGLHAASPHAPVASTPEPAASAAEPAAAHESAKEPDEVKPQPKPAAPAQPALVAQRSEVELLFDARKAMPGQPTAALRILDEHAARFPNGLLGPEREVLRIEALRKLDRTAEAAKRLQQFEARYPESIHLRRLQGDASTAQ
jgi:hypothetical protein